MDIFDRDSGPEGLGDDPQAVGRLFAERLTQSAFSAELNLIETIQAGFQRTQRLLETLLEISADSLMVPISGMVI